MLTIFNEGCLCPNCGSFMTYDGANVWLKKFNKKFRQRYVDDKNAMIEYKMVIRYSCSDCSRNSSNYERHIRFSDIGLIVKDKLIKKRLRKI